MRLDGSAIVVTGIAVVVGLAPLLAYLWDRTGILARTAVALGCVLALVGTAALQLNRMTEAYPSWSALRGTKADLPEEPTPGQSSGPPVTPASGSRIQRLSVAGPASGLTLPMYVYLPAAYDRDPHTRFPVIEALHGYPGTPRTWINRLHVQSYLDTEIRAGRMAPTVVLLPYQTTEQFLDTECTDLAPHGPHIETFLTSDVPAYARSHFRVRADRAAWGLIGYSAGGYCATNLALRHPGEYAAGASLSGYAEPGITVGDGSEKTTNNDDWRLTHLPQPAVSLYLAWAADDPGTKRESLRLAALAKAPLEVTTAFVARGGHSHAAWRAMEGPAFDWLSAHLARPW